MEKKKVESVQCPQCGETKLRIFAGKKDGAKNNVWVDEYARRWNGSLCPACHALNMKAKMKALREKRKNEQPK